MVAKCERFSRAGGSVVFFYFITKTMKVSYLFAIYVVCACIRVYKATILVKFGSAPSVFKRSMEKGYSGTDPLDNFGLRGRQILCDAVINATQFTNRYPPSYYEARPGGAKNTLVEWDAPKNTMDTMNYQKYDFAYDLYLSDLSYQTRIVLLDDEHKQVKTIFCVNTMSVKWFVTFGFVDKFMYLLEPSRSKKKGFLRVTGIFEPNPVIESPDSKYFYSQFRSAKELLQSVCSLPAIDVLRVCSVILDALDKEGSLKRPIGRLNHVKRERRLCIQRAVKTSDDGKFVFADVLRCSIFRQGTASDEFYALADSRERGSMFVFLPRENGVLELHARITKIGALINPAGSPEVKLQPEDNSEEKIEKRSRSKRKAVQENLDRNSTTKEVEILTSSEERKQLIEKISAKWEERNKKKAKSRTKARSIFKEDLKTRSKGSKSKHDEDQSTPMEDITLAELRKSLKRRNKFHPKMAGSKREAKSVARGGQKMARECVSSCESTTDESRRKKSSAVDEANNGTRTRMRNLRKSKRSLILIDWEDDSGDDRKRSLKHTNTGSTNERENVPCILGLWPGFTTGKRSARTKRKRRFGIPIYL